MTGQEEKSLGFAAFPVRSPLVRHRPWLSDSTWIAHESLQLFSQLAGVMGANGWWQLTHDGPVHHGDGGRVDLAAMVADFYERSEPCVVHADQARRVDSVDEAVAFAGTQEVEVLDPDGRVWRFDQDRLTPATYLQTEWSWRIADHSESVAALVGVDRKDRPRFVLLSLSETTQEGTSA